MLQRLYAWLVPLPPITRAVLGEPFTYADLWAWMHSADFHALVQSVDMEAMGRRIGAGIAAGLTCVR